MHFVDQVQIHVKGGRGGNGAVAFRREKYVPMGGPSGGDGGDGGSVVLVVDGGLSTLLDFRYKREHFAPSGEPGANKDKYGRAGVDLTLRVPPGTAVYDEGTETLLADLRLPGETAVVARGGKGGRGNIHFASSTDRAPRRSEPGLPGDERRLRLDLKLIADIGLLGFPNVGKSSLIARISAARPKIADYPFTTLVPNLGVVRLSGERTLVVADVPGLIEGAHTGAGLGHRFLRHLERTRVLVHLLEAEAVPGRTPLGDFATLERELALFDPALATREQIVVLNKIDRPEVRRLSASLARSFRSKGLAFHAISAATGEGLPELLEILWAALTRTRRDTTTPPAPPAETGDPQSVAAGSPRQKPEEQPEKRRAPTPISKSPKAAAKKVAKKVAKPVAKAAAKKVAKKVAKPAAETSKRPPAPMPRRSAAGSGKANTRTRKRTQSSS